MQREKAVQMAQEKLDKTQALKQAHVETENALRKRLAQFEQENAKNLNPVPCCFRLDSAGFGAYENIAWLIDMGYEVYVKLHNHKIVQMLKDKVGAETPWKRVGKNAEMAAWKDFLPKNFPYPLDVALERFYIGETQNIVPGPLWRYPCDHCA